MTTLLERLAEQLEAFPPVRLAAVFGSVARGTAHARSDIDLALRLDPDSAALRQEIEVALARGPGPWSRPCDWYEWKPYADRLFAAALERLRERVRSGQA